MSPHRIQKKNHGSNQKIVDEGGDEDYIPPFFGEELVEDQSLLPILEITPEVVAGAAKARQGFFGTGALGKGALAGIISGTQVSAEMERNPSSSNTPIMGFPYTAGGVNLDIFSSTKEGTKKKGTWFNWGDIFDELGSL